MGTLSDKHRKVAVLRRVIPFLHYVLFIVGIALYFVLPLIKTQPIVHDESNLRTRFSHSSVQWEDIQYGMNADKVFSKKREESVTESIYDKKFVVAGKRASGSDSFLFINAGESRAAVLALSKALRRVPFLSMDIHFYFVRSLQEASKIEVPQGLVRGAILLDFPSPAVSSVYVHTFGKDGLQSNQDAVNVVVNAFLRFNLEVKMTRTFDAVGLSVTQKQFNEKILSFISRYVGTIADYFQPLLPTVPKNPHHYSPQGVTYHFSDFILSMVQSDVTSHYGGGTLRSDKGLCIVGISANKERPDRLKDEYTSLSTVVSSLEHAIRAFNNLNERLHHSYPVWVNIGPSHFVDYAVLQSIPFVQIGCGVVGLLNFIAVLTNRRASSENTGNYNSSRSDRLGAGALLMILVPAILAMTSSVINSEVKVPNIIKHLLWTLDEKNGEILQVYSDFPVVHTQLSLSYCVASFPGLFILMRRLFMFWGPNTLQSILPTVRSVIIAIFIWTLGWMALYIALHPGLSLVGNTSLALQLLMIGVLYHPMLEYSCVFRRLGDRHIPTVCFRVVHFVVLFTVRIVCCIMSTGLLLVWGGVLGDSPSTGSISLCSFVVTSVMIWSVSIAKLFM